MEIDKNFLQKVLSIALDTGGDFAEIFWEEKISNSIYLENRKIEENSVGFDKGVGIRVIMGESSGYAYTDDLTDKAIINTAKIARSIAKNGNIKSPQTLHIQKSNLNFSIKLMPDVAPVEEKIQLVRKANEAAYNYAKEVTQVVVSYKDYKQTVCIANSEGQLVEDERIYTYLMVQTIATKDRITQTGTAGRGGFCGMELYIKYPPELIGKESAEKAVKMLSAKPAKAGTMCVVISAGNGGVLFHEACGHGLEADHIQKSGSVYAGKIGTKVASECITLIDDGTMPGRQGSFRFDDEGTEAKKNVLIENGILKNYMYDYITAKHDKTLPTGNGRRQSYQYIPIPRMTNTYIEKGKYTPDEIIHSIECGLLVKSLGGGMVNVVSGDFVFSVTEGYMIEKGKITYPVRGANLIGNGPKILQMIDMVGNDLTMDDGIGICGKGQLVPVSCGQPTLRIPQITVGGTE